MPVISNGKQVTLGTKAYASRQAPGPTHWGQKLYYAGNKGPRMSVYGDEAVKNVEEKLAIVRTHFGVNISDALKIALHLTANAIRKNCATPEV